MSTSRAVRLPLLATPVALALAVGVLTSLPSRAADAYTAQGTATLPSPVGFGVTDTSFTASCPDPGPAQGTDGWVFTLPAGHAGDSLVVTGSDGATVGAYVYDSACSYLRTEDSATFVVGPTDAFVSVFSYETPQVTFDLSIVPLADPGPTATPTPTATSGTGSTTLRTRHAYPTTPNDPLFNEVPFLVDGTSAGTGQWGMQKVQAPQAWQETQATGAGVQVAVLDSGLDLGHPDLACEGKVRIAPGATPSGELPQDVDGHGTHVAGIIGACTDNDEGVVGVAPDATLLPFRVLGPDGGTAEDLANAIRAAADAGAHVINMSIGFSAQGAPGTGSALALLGGFAEDIDPAIAYAVSKGVVVVSTSGNETFPLCGYPALADDVVCVGSVDRRDLPAFYSNFALKADGGEPTNGFALVAPGGSGQVFCDLSSENILSTYARDLDTCDEGAGAGYEGLDGTSMAAPHVAGAAALLYDRLGAVRSPENALKVKQALVGTAVDLGVPGYDPQFGSGRLDVLAAVRSLAPVTSAPTQTATALTLTAPTSGQRTDALPVTVALKDAAGAAVVGAPVELTLGGAATTVTTGADGTATASLPLSGRPGAVELSATYAGGAATLPSGAHQQVDVVREDTGLIATASSKNAKQVVVGRLSDADAATSGVAGVTLVLVDDKGQRTPAVTDATGQARWEPSGSVKSKSFQVIFAGDELWAPASATA